MKTINKPYIMKFYINLGENSLQKYHNLLGIDLYVSVQINCLNKF